MSFRFAPAPRTGDIVLDAKGLGASRGGTHAVRGRRSAGSARRSHRHRGAERRREDHAAEAAWPGAEPPKIAGQVRRGTNLLEGYFDQHLGSLDPSRTAVEEVRSIRGDLNVDGARQYLARFRFYGDDPLRRVSGFSGGERSRLALAKLLLEPRNLLFLDEPTNHLDIPAAEILEEALVGFEGTVILVSHDRRFLETVTTRTISVRDGVCDIYPGGFSDFVGGFAAQGGGPRRSRRAASCAPKAEGAGSCECTGAARIAVREGRRQGPVRTRESRRSGRRSAPKASDRTGRPDCRSRGKSWRLARAIERGSRGQLGEDCEFGSRGASFDEANRVDDVGMVGPRRRVVSRGGERRREREQFERCPGMTQASVSKTKSSLRAWHGTLAIALALVATSCKRRSTDDAALETEPHATSLPPLVLTDDTPDLLITWVDGRGDAHPVRKPSDVPDRGARSGARRRDDQ